MRNLHADQGHQLLSTDVARRLEQFVLDNGYRPGDKLPSERELALRFEVSRTAIREAIKICNQNGLLESSVGRGLYVSNVSTKPLFDSLNVLLQLGESKARYIVEVRNALETLAARLAAVYATDEELDEIAACVTEMEARYARNEGYSGVGEDIHLALGRASHNPLLLALLEPTMHLMTQTGDGYLLPAGPTRQGLVNHQRLLAALRAHDPDAAQEAIEIHCAYLMELRNQVNPDWEEVVFGSSPSRMKGVAPSEPA